MEMNTYIVKYSVNGESGYSIAVQAKDSITARKIAKGELAAQAGYVGCKIVVGSAVKA
jgi:hypothetical protein